MKQTDFTQVLNRIITQLGEGAFLVSGNQSNPMTIGWAQFGIVWGKPICTVFVRKSRFSHNLMEENESFTVSVPLPQSMKKELAFCGSKSGRDINKLDALKLTVAETPDNGRCLSGCCVHIVCRTVAKTDLSLKHINEGIHNKFYNTNQATADGDPHTMYFGEILSVYTDEE